MMTKRSRNRLILLSAAVLVAIRLFCGVFVIQPLGAIPEGTTIIYWRSGLNMPFIASADGILAESGRGVSILGRALVLGTIAERIIDREIFRAPYSETLYLWSTGGYTYAK